MTAATSVGATLAAVYWSVRRKWEMNCLCRKVVGNVSRPYKCADDFSLAEAVVRRGNAEAVIRAGGTS